MLPEQEQKLVNALIKRMVLAWDSDFTKLTKAIVPLQYHYRQSQFPVKAPEGNDKKRSALMHR